MDAFITQMAKFDPHRLTLAPLFGLLAGFLANRALGGETGWMLAAQMVAGAALVTLGACVASNVSKLLEEQEREQQLAAVQADQAVQVQHIGLVQAEAERYRLERYFREQVLAANRRAEAYERKLLQTETRGLPVDIAARLAAIEAAQQQMRVEHVEISRKAAMEAEQVKASLLQLAITESQRQRNVAAPENDQSGRIIELEARIHRLARELESLSSRQVAAAGQGPSHAPQAGPDKARMGFLQAMLDANKTLRQSAA